MIRSSALPAAGPVRAVHDITRARDDFPILSKKVHGKPLVYLDNAATTQKPEAVIAAIRHYYCTSNANVHRGVHALSDRATQAYEEARSRVARFLNAREDREIVFVRGAEAVICHLGDSRVYLFRRGTLRRVTTDDNYAAVLAESRKISADRIPSAYRHILTQAVGVSERLVPEIHTLGLEPGDLDGAWDQLVKTTRYHPEEGLLGGPDDFNETLKKQLKTDASKANGTSIAFLAEFDGRQPALLTVDQLQELDRLSGDVRRIWNHPRANMVLKKQIVRALIEEIVVDVEESTDEVLLTVHWAGGHHTPLRVSRRSGRSHRKVNDVVVVVDTLRKVLNDTAIATALNREKIGTDEGTNWTARRVAAFRKKSYIPAHSARTQEANGWITQAQAATSLDISPMSVARFVRAGIIPAEQPHPGLPTVINRDALQLDQVKNAVLALKNSHNRPLSHDPNQLSLYDVTDF